MYGLHHDSWTNQWPDISKKIECVPTEFPEELWPYQNWERRFFLIPDGLECVSKVQQADLVDVRGLLCIWHHQKPHAHLKACCERCQESTKSYGLRKLTLTFTVRHYPTANENRPSELGFR